MEHLLDIYLLGFLQNFIDWIIDYGGFIHSFYWLFLQKPVCSWASFFPVTLCCLQQEFSWIRSLTSLSAYRRTPPLNLVGSI